jgi:hypothetical protein
VSNKHISPDRTKADEEALAFASTAARLGISTNDRWGKGGSMSNKTISPDRTKADEEALCRATEVLGKQQVEIGRLRASNAELVEAGELMLAYEDHGGDGWWKGWDKLKAAIAAAKEGA